ncbi:hypothetical protein PQX77_006810 [Marasmius sp. AFHP31]|nr:hypothetical protein PQX77_006810 [Marasmius sp. AFHP31]
MKDSSRAPTLLSRRYTSATIDLSLNPGEILFALHLLCQSGGIEIAEFVTTSRDQPEWGPELATKILPTLVSHLPNVHHFMLVNISTRFQWTLMEAAKNQLTTLELHSSPFVSWSYTVPRVKLERLNTLRLLENVAATAAPFLTRVVLCIDAPNVEALSICNCLSDDPIPVREALRYFSPRLRTLGLLHDQRPDLNVPFQHDPLPLLPNVVHLELEASWAPLYVGATSDTMASLQSLAFQALPEQVMGGLRVVDWHGLRLAWEQVRQPVRTIEWSCRSGEALPPDSLLSIVKENFDAVGLVLPDNVQLCEGFRTPLPIPPAFDDDHLASRAWGTHE